MASPFVLWKVLIIKCTSNKNIWANSEIDPVSSVIGCDPADLKTKPCMCNAINDYPIEPVWFPWLLGCYGVMSCWAQNDSFKQR